MENARLVVASYTFLRKSVYKIKNKKLKEATKGVLDDHRFIASPAAKSQHQAYFGGLVVHTAEVMRSALAVASQPHMNADLQVLIPAVVWHDYGKIYDYTVKLVGSPETGENCVIDYTPHQGMIRHLARSYAMFMAAMENKINDDLLMSIGHCILSHHGRKEWGSPVEPMTTEAHILHYSDCLSAFCAKKLYEIPDAE